MSDNTLSKFPISGGTISLGPIPDVHQCSRFKEEGVSHIVTITTAEENAGSVRDVCAISGIKWLWMPFANTLDSSEMELEHLRQYVHELKQFLNESAHIYLHCDGSLQRCRLLFFALLHHLHIPSSSAYSVLHSFGAQGTNQLSRSELQWAAALGSSARK